MKRLTIRFKELLVWRLSSMQSRLVTEGRLRAALQRLLEGNPERIKKTDNLSLNKINKEAGLGHSYIHKFKEFVVNEANPAITEFNAKERAEIEAHVNEDDLTQDSKLKLKLKKEVLLKEQYRKERDDAKQIIKALEKQNSSLIFRLYELQEELRHNKVMDIR